MVSRFEYILKGVLLTLLGVVLLFFPKVITGFFYVLGAIIVIGCVLSVLGSGLDGTMVGPGIVGILIGVLIFMLPRIVASTISIILCVVFCMYGLSRIAKAVITSSKSSRIVNLIVGILLVGAGIFFGFDHLSAGKLTRIVAGIVIMLLAVFNFMIAHVITQRNKGASPSKVVEVNDYTVRDEHKFLK